MPNSNSNTKLLEGLPLLDAGAKIYERFVGRGPERTKNGTRMEIYASSQRINMFRFQFQSVSDGRQQSYLSVYLTCEQAIFLFKRMAFTNMKDMTVNGEAVKDLLWQPDHPMGSLGKDGRPAEYRRMAVYRGQRHDYAITAGRCDAKVIGNGLFSPLPGAPHSKKWTIFLERADAISIYYKLLQAYFGYGSAQWAMGALFGEEFLNHLRTLINNKPAAKSETVSNEQQNEQVDSQNNTPDFDEPIFDPETGELEDQDFSNTDVPADTPDNIENSDNKSSGGMDDIDDYDDLPF